MRELGSRGWAVRTPASPANSWTFSTLRWNSFAPGRTGSFLCERHTRQGEHGDGVRTTRKVMWQAGPAAHLAELVGRQLLHLWARRRALALEARSVEDCPGHSRRRLREHRDGVSTRSWPSAIDPADRTRLPRTGSHLHEEAALHIICLQPGAERCVRRGLDDRLPSCVEDVARVGAQRPAVAAHDVERPVGGDIDSCARKLGS